MGEYWFEFVFPKLSLVQLNLLSACLAFETPTDESLLLQWVFLCPVSDQYTIKFLQSIDQAFCTKELFRIELLFINTSATLFIFVGVVVRGCLLSWIFFCSFVFSLHEGLVSVVLVHFRPRYFLLNIMIRSSLTQERRQGTQGAMSPLMLP
jgi:hypothetical protein